MSARCSECRTRTVKKSDGTLVIHHTADCPENIKNRGEYRVETIRFPSPDWVPSLDFDPLVDWDNLFTENALHEMRVQVTRLNRDGYAYRVRYVTADERRLDTGSGPMVG